MSRLQRRVVVTAALLCGAVAAVAIPWIDARVAEVARAQHAEALAKHAALVLALAGDGASEPPALERGAGEALESAARRVALASGTRVVLLDARGESVADSRPAAERPPGAPGFADRPEVRAALAGGRGVAVRPATAGSPALLQVAVPHPAGPGSGVIWVAAELAPAQAAAASIRARLMLCAALATLAVLAIVAYLARGVGEPLVEIRDALAALAAGQAPRPWTRSARHELRDVARGVDRLRKGFEAQLARVEDEREQLRAVLRGVDFGVIVLDAAGRMMLASRGVRDLFGVEGPIEGHMPLEVLRNAELDRVLTRILEAAPGADSLHAELRIDGPRVRHVDVRASRVALERGHCAVAVLHDQTELRRLARVRRDFVANASHELRTPLTAIRGFAEILADNEVARDTQVQYLRIIVQHAERLSRLADDLLSLSTVEGGAAALRLEPLDVGSAADRVLTSLEPLFAERKVTAKRAFSGPVRATADARLLEQVLTNLLDNAAKYTEPGGRIAVRAEVLADTVRVSVEDTGMGIPAADRHRIFERFYRVDKAHSRTRGGTGLGLAIVRNGVEAMGGEVGVDSTPGRGSTFYFTLRRAPETPARPTA
jgi:two-component system phosphate regulon sensor histidine kinase PhoR